MNTNVVRLLLWVPVVLSLLAGCTADTETVGSSTGPMLVRRADYETQVRYLDFAVAPRPLAADEIGDPGDAVAVQVEFYDQFAVAWRVVDGVKQIGRGGFVAAWPVSGYAHTTGDVAPGEGGEVTAPSQIPDLLGENATVGDIGDGVSVAAVPGGFELPFAWVEWYEDFLVDWPTIERVHPGCI